MQRLNAGDLTSADVFGSREFLQNNCLYRFLAAKQGIYGYSCEEAIYPIYFVDANNNKLDAAKHRYTLRFEPNQLPPADAFWSLTMCDGQTQRLVRNSLQRYVLNSTLLETFKFGEDGSLTLYLQKDSPEFDLEANWLPTPDGSFYTLTQIYLPKPKMLNGPWKQPPIQRLQ